MTDKPKIINFSDYKERKEKELAKSLPEKIIKDNNLYNKNCSIPIIKIAKQYGFKVYKENLGSIIGKLSVDDGNIDIYKGEKIILVNNKYHIFVQRYITAYLLGYYLLYERKIIKCEKTTSSIKDFDKNAKIFAQNLLMPENVFGRQYNIAFDTDRRIYFVNTYLSKFFEVPTQFVEERILEIT